MMGTAVVSLTAGTNAAVAATASATMAAAVGVLSCLATPEIPEQWDGGFDFQFAITNTGTEPFDNWIVAFDLPSGDVVYTIWNGNVTQSGVHVVASTFAPASMPLAPGESVDSFGGVVLGPSTGGFTNVTCMPSDEPIE